MGESIYIVYANVCLCVCIHCIEHMLYKIILLCSPKNGDVPFSSPLLTLSLSLPHLLPSLPHSLTRSLPPFIQAENPNIRDFEASLTHLKRSHNFEKVLFACMVTKVGC